MKVFVPTHLIKVFQITLDKSIITNNPKNLIFWSKI